MSHQVPDFTKASILVIGDVMLDRYWFGDAARISPEAPVPVVKIQQKDERPGGAANVALNIAALGAKVTLVGITGDDEKANILEAELTAAKVSHALLRLPNIPTITKLRVISRQQQLLRVDFEEKIPATNNTSLLQLFQKHLKTCNLIILSDYGKGTLSNPSEFIKAAKQLNIPVLVDPKGNDFNIYRHTDFITPNLKEFEVIVGKCENEQDIIQKGHQFLKDYDIDNILLTRGERGMTLIQKNKEEIHLPAHAKEVFDVTGAGDSVIAVLGSALGAGAKVEQAMSLANLAASIVVSKLGAASVSSAELQVTMSDHHPEAGIVNDEQLLLAITAQRMRGKRIVFTNGCFDILHAGHVTYLQQAKKLGDFLVVAVNQDASVKKLKGKGRPINNVQQRMAVLASLGMVDWVISFADDTPTRLLKYLKPDILVKGGDYQSVEEVVGHEVVTAYGGEVRILGVIKDVSTTLIIDRMRKEVTDA